MSEQDFIVIKGIIRTLSLHVNERVDVTDRELLSLKNDIEKLREELRELKDFQNGFYKRLYDQKEESKRKATAG